VFCSGVDPSIIHYRVERKVRKSACKETDVGHSIHHSSIDVLEKWLAAVVEEYRSSIRIRSSNCIFRKKVKLQNDISVDDM
jgi:hypothetical protein